MTRKRFPFITGIIIGWVGVVVSVPFLLLWSDIGRLGAAIGLMIAFFGVGMSYGARVEGDEWIKAAGQ